MWNSCENWSIDLHYQHALAGNQVVVANVQCNVILVWLFVLKGQDHWGGGRGCNYPRLRVFLRGGCTQTITQAYWRWLWECCSELYMNVSSIKRLDTTFWNFVLKILAKFIICFLLFSSLPKGTFLKLNWYMCAMRTYIYCMSRLLCLWIVLYQL